jgi:AcrR family transcriptional regulator
MRIMPKRIDIDRLFEATVSVFSERGYDSTTTQEVARRAGVNEVTLFRRYGSKAGLIEAALTHCLSRSPFGQVARSDDVRADLAAIVDAYQKTYQAYGGAVFTLMAEVPRHPELRSVVSVLMPNLKKAARIIAQHQKQGRLRPGDPLRKLAFLIAPVMGAGLWARTGVKVDAFALDAATIVDAFLKGQGAA